MKRKSKTSIRQSAKAKYLTTQPLTNQERVIAELTHDDYTFHPYAQKVKDENFEVEYLFGSIPALQDLCIDEPELEEFGSVAALVERVETNRNKLNAAILKLTDKQKVIVELLLQGLNQTQIAAKLEVTQCYIHKAIYGNLDCSRNKIYGGIIQTIKKIINQTRLDNLNLKVCSSCQKELDKTLFGKCKTVPSGLNNLCKNCNKNNQRILRENK